VSVIGKGPFARSQRTKPPVARQDDLVVEELGDELLVYDQTNDCAHSLSAAATRVWRACDGERTAKALSTELEMDSNTVAHALEELDECNLLDNGHQLSEMTRREATLKGVKVGAAAASAPLIYSILAPVPALAATQLYCLAIGCVSGCGDCHKGGCACCGPGGNDNKICTQDCTTTFCNAGVIASHCTTSSPSFACNTSDARLKRDVSSLAVPLDLLR